MLHPAPPGSARLAPVLPPAPAWRRGLAGPLAVVAGVLALQGAPAGAGPAVAQGQVRPASASTPAPLPAQRGVRGPQPHWQHGVFMEIFVRAWKDSDGDGIGDLRGLTQTLDHLQELGIRGIWLMPVTKNADGDHGYATTDFRDIAPEYGTLADFDELLRQAHRRGIGVVMDYVLNHSAAEHPMFQGALQGPANPWRDWFVWSEDKPAGWDIWGNDPWYHAGSQPWTFRGDLKTLPRPGPEARDFYFGTFGPHMPDFNFRNPAVLAYHRESLQFWLRRGLDGFRLDAVPHLVERSARDWNDQPESRAITRQIADEVRAGGRPGVGRYVVCEATAEPQAWGDPAVCGGAFAFGHVHHYVGAALGKAESVQAVARYYTAARPTMATFVSNHDIFAGQRLWDQVGGDETRYRLAAAGYLLQPGTPFVYYGEHLGQAGIPGLSGDEPIRGPLSWTADGAGFGSTRPFRAFAPNLATHNLAAQRKDPRSIYHFYKAMIGLRNRLPSIARGSYEHAFAEGLVAGWQRALGRERTLVVINYGTAPARVLLPGLRPGAGLKPEFPAAGAVRRAALLELPPQSVQVFTVLPQR